MMDKEPAAAILSSVPCRRGEQRWPPEKVRRHALRSDEALAGDGYQPRGNPKRSRSCCSWTGTAHPEKEGDSESLPRYCFL